MPDTVGNLSFGADTRQMERDVQDAFRRLETGARLRLSPEGFTRPLGTIKSATDDFTKSLDASNARVLAFGASAGIIFAIQRAFTELTRAAIDVEKSLADINVILNLSQSNLGKFKNSLFSVAKETASSFSAVKDAALELSRQGLGVEETLKRSRDALILTRLSGLDAASAVQDLTGIINSFNKSSLTSTEIVSKLARVDANFAVSVTDLAEGIKRVGSTAQDVGVSLNELIGIITAVQQTTSRGGAVIGNALKSIFPRLSRADTIDKLKELGVAIDDTQTGLQKLQAVANAVNLASPVKANQIKELTGGVLQYNVVSATLGDLSKKYSIVARATEDASRATDEHIQRNQELNKTLDATLKRAGANLLQAGSTIGKATISPTIQRIGDFVNLAFSSEDAKESEGFGQKIGEGILSGIGQFLSGPGLVILLAGAGKLLFKFATDASAAFQSILNLNKASFQQEEVQKLITQELSNQPNAIERIREGSLSVLEVQNNILASIRAQIELSKFASTYAPGVSASITGAGYSAQKNKSGSSSFVPNFSPLDDAFNREAARVPISSIRVSSDSRLISSSNPTGLGVYNTKDEPLGLSQGIVRRGAGGGIPNFAIGDDVHFGRSQSAFANEPLIQGQLRLVAANLAEVYSKGILSQKALNKSIENISEKYKLSEKGLEDYTAAIGQEVQLRKAAGLRMTNIRGAGIPTAGSEFLGPAIPSGFGLKMADTKLAETIKEAVKPLEQISNLKLKGLNDLTMVDPGRDARDNSERASQKLAEVERLQNLKMVDPVFNRSLSMENPALNRINSGEDEKQLLALAEERKRQLRERINSLGERAGGLLGGGARKELSTLSQGDDYAGNVLASAQSRRASKIQTSLLIGSLVAPLVGNTAASLIGDETPIKRGFGSLSRSLSDSASFAALGGSFGGPYTAAAFGAGSLLVNLPKIIKDFNDPIPDLQKNIEKMKETLNKSNDAFSRFIELTEKVNDFREGKTNLSQSEGRRLELLRKGALGELPEEQRNEISQVFSRGGIEAARSKFAEYTTQNANIIVSSGASISISSLLNKNDSFTQQGLSGVQAFAGSMGRVYQSDPGTIALSTKGEKYFEQIKNQLFSVRQSDTGKGLIDLLQENPSTGKKLSQIKDPKQFFNSLRNLSKYNGLGDLISPIDEMSKSGVSELLMNSLKKSFDPKELAKQDAQEEIDRIKDRKKIKDKENFDFDTRSQFSNLRDIQAKFAFSSSITNERLNSFGQITSTQNEANLRGREAFISPEELQRFKSQEQLRKISSEGNVKQVFLNNKFRSDASSTLTQLYDSGAEKYSKSIEKELDDDARQKKAEQFKSKLNQNILNPNLISPEELQKYINKLPGEITADKSRIDNSEVADRKKELEAELDIKREILKKGNEILLKYKEEGQALKINTSTLEKIAKITGQSEQELLTQQRKINYGGGLSSIISQSNLRAGYDASIAFNLRGNDLARGKGAEGLAEIIKGRGMNIPQELRATLENNAQAKILKEKPGVINSKELAQTQVSNKYVHDVELKTESLANVLTDLSKNLTEFDRNILELNTVTARSDNERLYKAGLKFTGDYAAEASKNRQSDILLGKYNPIGGGMEAFSNELKYSKKDLFRDFDQSVVETADILKSSFKDAFHQMVFDSKSATDALRNFGIAIATKLFDRSIDMGGNLLFNGLQSLGSAAVRGVRGYSSGGKVLLGSGLKDDVPTMLTQGEFVINKQAAAKIGDSNLNKINNGVLNNTFEWNDPLTSRGYLHRPTVGKLNVDSRLSNFALTDENNPQNQRRMEREQTFYQYIKDKRDYDLNKKYQLDLFQYGKDQRVIGAAVSAATSVAGSALSSAFKAPTGSFNNTKYGVGYQNSNSKYDFNPGGSFNSYQSYGGLTHDTGANFNSYGMAYGHMNGGLIQHFANGGKALGNTSGDNIPAMLSDGEWVIKKSAVDKYGVHMMDNINHGRFKGFSDGGSASLVPSIPNDFSQKIAESLNKIVEATQNLTNALSKKPEANKENSTASVVNNIEMHFTIQKDGKVADTSKDKDSKNGNETDTAQKLGEKMKAVVLNEMNVQLRPGGILYQASKK